MYCRLRDLREDHDMKQKDLAAYLNCSQQVYSNYELGQRDVPTDILIRLSQLYHVSVDYILGLTDNPKITRPPIRGSEGGFTFVGSFLRTPAVPWRGWRRSAGRSADRATPSGRSARGSCCGRQQTPRERARSRDPRREP